MEILSISWKPSRSTHPGYHIWSIELVEVQSNTAEFSIQLANTATHRDSTLTSSSRWGSWYTTCCHYQNIHSTGLHHIIDVIRFRKLSKLLSITVYLYHFTINCHQQPISSQQKGAYTNQLEMDTRNSLTALQESYWVPSAHQWIKSIIHKIMCSLQEVYWKAIYHSRSPSTSEVPSKLHWSLHYHWSGFYWSAVCPLHWRRKEG